ncbi:MAG: NAD(P)-dependent oxidoreductase, partial [Hungatella sp.]
YPKETVKKYAEYVSLDRLWSASDLITLHAPATEETYHLIDEETLKQMKDGVILINAARGSLIHTTALIAALESGKVGAAA